MRAVMRSAALCAGRGSCRLCTLGVVVQGGVHASSADAAPRRTVPVWGCVGYSRALWLVAVAHVAAPRPPAG